MMLDAYIKSPRFDDYKIVTVPEYPEQLELEREINKVVADATKIARRRKAPTGQETGETEEDEAIQGYSEHVKAWNDYRKQYTDLVKAMDKRVDSWDLPEDDTLNQSAVAGAVSRGYSSSRNPLGVGSTLLGMLPHTALVALAIQLTPLIIDQLKSPGNYLDVRWKRIMMDEFNAMLERQDQWDTMIGLRQTIVQSKAGFLMESGAAMTENNLRQRREGGVDGNRLALIDFTDHSKEMF